jgi:hypothetical protein
MCGGCFQAVRHKPRLHGRVLQHRTALQYAFIGCTLPAGFARVILDVIIAPVLLQ